ncbi:MAG: hypothetical protein GX226_06795 [Dehalococcoidales bacterium]|nr:hypothetical protein [Dehalococcoidales bacterium]
MKGLSATFTTIGVLCLAMAIFTIIGMAPAFVDAIWEFSDKICTTIFWFFISLILILAGNAYGVLDREP